MRACILAIAVFFSVAVQSQLLVMTDETTDVTYVTRHLAGRLEGSFKGVNGSARFDPANLSSSYFKMTFAVATVTTNDPHVGPNFIQEECFHPARYPNVELFSTSIRKMPGENQYIFNGQLKIKGKTRNVSFPMTVTANAGGYDFLFAFAFRRKDFDLQCGAMGKDFKIGVRAYGKGV